MAKQVFSRSWVATRLGSAPDQVGKHGGLADLGMPGRGEQRQRPAPGQLPQVLERWGALDVVEFLAVTAVELLEPFGVVAVPLAQLCRRGDLLAPLVEAGLVLVSPRGQTRSTSTRVPSSGSGSS